MPTGPTTARGALAAQERSSPGRYRPMAFSRRVVILLVVTLALMPLLILRWQSAHSGRAAQAGSPGGELTYRRSAPAESRAFDHLRAPRGFARSGHCLVALPREPCFSRVPSVVPTEAALKRWAEEAGLATGGLPAEYTKSYHCIGGHPSSRQPDLSIQACDLTARLDASLISVSVTSVVSVDHGALRSTARPYGRPHQTKARGSELTLLDDGVPSRLASIGPRPSGAPRLCWRKVIFGAVARSENADGGNT